MERSTVPRNSQKRPERLLDRVADDHGLSQADAVLAIMRGVMTFHQSRDENYTSPIVKGMRRNNNGKARARILSAPEIERAITASTQKNGSLITTGGFGSLAHRDLIIALAAEHKLPTVYWNQTQEPAITN